MGESAVSERIARFKSDLAIREPLVVTHRTILSGDCYALHYDEYMSLREAVSDHFALQAMEVVVVGSAKLGFSIAPHKRYRPFGDESDIDVAIASPVLFDEIWKRTLEYSYSTQSGWQRAEKFKAALFRGWIRPDYLPAGGAFETARDWWEFFRSLTASGQFGQLKITGALYRSWYHLERYQVEAVRWCREGMGENLT